MELRHLAAFVAVAEELHFGRAAERLGIAQPAVSRLVRRVEDELGVALFERSSHRVALTSGGAALLPRARAVLAERDALAAAAEAFATGVSGTLRLGTTEPMGARLTVLLERFAAAQPGIRVEMRPAHTPEKVAALRAGELDVAFVRGPTDVSGLRVEQLWRAPLVAVLPAAHPRAGDESVSPADLEDLPLLMAPRSRTPGVHDALRAATDGAALTIVPFEREQEALATIATGGAWTLMEAGAATGLPGVAIRALSPPAAALEVALAWRPAGASRVTEAFVGVARTARDDGALA